MITYPLDTVRARLTVQTSQQRYNGIIDAFRTIYMNEGIVSGYYKGIAPTLLAVAPFVAMQQSTYDVIKQSSMEYGNFEPSVPLFMSCGAVAAMTAQSVVYPLDLIRRRMQVPTPTSTTSSSCSVPTAPVAARGIFTESYLWLAVGSIVKERGVKGLYRGIVPTF